MRKESISPMVVDKRVVERNIKKGLLSREDFDKHLSALPDVAEQAEEVKARLGEEPEDDDEDIDDEEEDDAAEG